MFHRRHRVGEGFERRLFATHHAYVYRHVAAYVFGARVDADVFGVRPEGEFADLRHAILADQRDDVGAGERVRRGVGRKRTRIRKLPLHRAGFYDRNLGLLGQFLQRVPGAAVKDAVARNDDRALGLFEQFDRRRDVLRPRMRPVVRYLALS